MRWKLIFLFAACALSAAVLLLLLPATDPFYPGEARWILAAPDRVEIYTVDPDSWNAPLDQRHVDVIGGYLAFDKRPLAEVPAQRLLLAAIAADVSQDPIAKGCRFEPRHALRAWRGGQTVTFLVCYHCGELEIEQGNARKWTNVFGASKLRFDAALLESGIASLPQPSTPSSFPQ